MNSSKLSYRAEIDGLRAIAVVSVILYHAQIVLFGSDWFEGGFIGVDIFFVISGYLITRIILSELQSKGSFSFLNFYERRARRILPMLFVVIFVSIPYAWQKLLPSDFVEYAESILASLFFGSNFFFYFSATEYGADSALLKPFLHTWSLGVEEQFYLVFPILAIVAFKYFRKHFLTILVGLSVLSLQFSEFMEVRNSDLNFYLPFSRFWELAVGSMLAYRELNHKPSDEGLASKVLPMLGLYLIAYSILFFDSQIPHPSFHTLIPIFGVALIIGFASKDELVGKVLGSKPFVWVGLISYSAYLWHFPIFAFSRINSDEPQFSDKLEIIAASFFLSVLSYKFIERPLRSRKTVNSKFFFIYVLICTSLVLCLAIITKERDGFPSRFLQGWSNYELDDGKLRKGFWKYFDDNKQSLVMPSQTKVNVYIFGNSHSGDFLGALFSQRESYENYHFLKVLKQEQLSCFDERDDRFLNHRNVLYTSDAYKKADVFVIATRFINAHCNKTLKDNPTDADGLSFLIPKLKKDGKKIIILGNTLVLDRTEGAWLEEKIYWDAVEDKIDFRSFEVFENFKMKAEKKAYGLQSKFNFTTNQRLKEFSSQNELTYFDRRSLFCDDEAQRCLVFDDDGFRIRYDYGHLTLKGKVVFGKLLQNSSFESILSEVAQKQGKFRAEFIPFEGTVRISPRF